MLEHAYEPSTWLPYLLIVANLLSSLAWPLAAFALIFTFRKQIRDFIPNIEHVNAPGLAIGLRKGQGNPAIGDGSVKPELEKLDPNEPNSKEAEQLGVNVLRSAPLLKIEEALHAEVSALPEAERVPTLLTALAQARLDSAFNLAYANILGSQIRALKLLNSRGGRISRNAAEKEFSDLKEAVPELKDWTLENYLGFLRHYLFIEEDKGDIVLTEFGREFLGYLPRKGLSEERAY